MFGLVPLAAGATLWLLGLWVVGRAAYQSPKTLEYWWCYAAFALGGVATLTPFALPELDGNLVLAARIAPLILLSSVLLLRALTSGGLVTATGGALVALLVLFVIHGVINHSWQTSLLSVGLLSAVFATPRRGYSLAALQAGSRDATAALIIMTVGVTLLRPTAALGVCRLDKCSVWGVALGPAGTGNAIGLVLAVLGVVTLMQARRIGHFLLIALGSAVLVDLTSGRSAAITWTVGLALSLLLALSRRAHSLRPIRVGVVAIVVVVALLPFGPWKPADFTFRAELWQRAFFLFQQQPLWGYGSSFWVSQSATVSLSANYATHNLVTELLVSGGLFGVVLFVVVVGSAVARRGVAPYAIAVLGVALGASLTEVVSAPGRIYILPGLLPFALLAVFATPTRPVPEPRSRSDALRLRGG